MNYPELMDILKELVDYYDDFHLGDSDQIGDALWVAIEILQITEWKDGRVSTLLQQLETQRVLQEGDDE
jgi:hypothetical protein